MSAQPDYLEVCNSMYGCGYCGSLLDVVIDTRGPLELLGDDRPRVEDMFVCPHCGRPGSDATDDSHLRDASEWYAARYER